MNEAEVKELVSPRIKGSTITEVEDFGDAFAIYFINDEYYKSQKLEDMMVGAGPIIYIKSTGEIFETGSGQSAEQYIRAYRECGDVYGRLSDTIELTGLSDTQDEKKAILALKSILGEGIAESKKKIEKIVNEGRIEVTLENEWGAEEAESKLKNSGFKVKRLWKKTC